MSKSLSYEDLGSDEVVVDFCSFCATKDKIKQAYHFCYDCGVFGRYICDNCTENHDIITASEDHDVRTFSGETNIRRENLDEFNDIEMRHRAEVEQLEQEKDEDIMELKEQINQLSVENTKNRAEITRLNQQKEKQDIKIEKLVQEKNEQYDHFKMQWEHQMGKVNEIWARENEIQTYQNEIEKLEEGKQEMISKFEAQAHELLEENANLQSDVERLNEEKEKLEAKIKELMQQKDAQYIELVRKRQDTRAELKDKYADEIDTKTKEVKALENKIHTLEKERFEFKTQFEQQMNTLRSENENIQSNIKRIREERNKYRAKTEELFEEREEQCAIFTDQWQEAKVEHATETQSKDREIRLLQVDIQNLKEKKHESARKFEKQLNDLTSDNKNLKSQTKLLKKEKEEMDIKIKELLRDKDAQYREYQRKIHESNGLSQKKLDYENQAMATELKRCKVEIQRSENREEEMKKQVSELRADNSKIKADITRIREERNKCRVTIEELKGQKDANRKMQEDHKKAMHALKNKYDDKIQAKDIKIQSLRGQRDNLQSMLQSNGIVVQIR